MPQTPQETSGPERRHLSIMFCDLIGSTAMSGQLDPEELRDVIRLFQDTCNGVIARFEGFVSRYMGDGVLVLFGYPRAHEDAAERAVHAGLGIIRALADINAAPDRQLPVELGVRIGIASGLVVAGDVIGEGSAAQEQTVVGETPNLAARLQGLGEANSVVIADSTKQLVADAFELADFGLHELRGFPQPMQVWRVVAERSRAKVGATREQAPLVGREPEIGLLLHRWEEAKDNEGQVVLIVGEPGIGKSRIVQGFGERLKQSPDEFSRVLYYGSPHHQHSAFYPVIDQLERVMRFSDDESNASKLEKLEALLHSLDLPVQDFAPYLASLLSLPATDRYRALTLAPEELRKKTLDAVIGLVQAMATRRPVLMVVEDTHWIDPSSLELLGLLIERFQSSCFLLLIVFRPEFQPPWSGFTHVSAITLNRLSRKESARLITKVTKGKSMPDEIVAEIVAKTDGIPLFVEELTKTVLESNQLEDAGDRYVLSAPLQSLAIPTSLQDSLMARLDHLGPTKELAQTGAAIGREFSHDLIAAVSDLSEIDLNKAIDELLQSKLVYRLATTHTTYSFKHALVQKVAYESLLRSRRKPLHARIAQTVLDMYPELTTSQPEVLAHHFTEAGMSEMAVDFWHKAGKRAAEISANNEALRHFTNGLELLNRLPDTQGRQEHELQLQLDLGDTFRAAKGTAASETAEAYRRARALSEQLGDQQALTHALDGQSASYFERAELTSALEAAQQLLRIGEDRDNATALVVGHESVGVCSFALGRLEAARTHLENALEHGARLEQGSSVTLAQFPYTSLLYLSWSLYILGYPDEAMARCSQAMAQARETSPLNLALTLGNSCYLYQFCQDQTAIEARIRELIPLADDKGFPVWLGIGNFFKGWALTQTDKSAEGIELMRQALPHVEDIEAPYFFALMAEACGKAGQFAEAQTHIDEAQARIDKTGERWYQAELHRLRGELLFAQPKSNGAGAETCFQRALEVARDQNARMWELRAAVALSHLWQGQGKEQQARELLEPIYAWFGEQLGTAGLKRLLMDSAPAEIT